MAKNNALNFNLPSVDDLFSTEESRAEAKLERIVNLNPSEISNFPNHPFKVRMDSEMLELIDSVKQHGILLPALVRPKPEGGYEMVSGHRRKKAAELAGFTEIPCIVRNLDNDEAIIVMVDSNLQRERVLPSEKAFAYKMKLDAMKRQGQRTDLTSLQLGEKLNKKTSVRILAEQATDNVTSIQRYVRLNKLIPPLLDVVDAGTLKFVPAADFLSHLSEKEQTYLLLVMERDEVSPSLGQAQRLKQLSAEGKLENNIIDLIMREEKPLERKVTIRNDRLQKYFPSSYTPKQMEDVIIKLLEGWHRKRQQEQAR